MSNDKDSTDETKSTMTPFVVSTLMSPEAVKEINEHMKRAVAGAGPFKTPVYTPRPASQIAESMLRAALRRHAPEEAVLTPSDLLHTVSDTEPSDLDKARAGGVACVSIFVSSSALDLLTSAADKYGLNLEAFILDAAVCRAQDIRTECARNREPFSKRTDAEDVRARPAETRPTLKLVE